MSSLFKSDNDSIKKDPVFSSPNKSLLVSDLDSFYQNIYEYYHQKGYRNILTNIILENVSFFFSVNFIFINSAVIDWLSLIKSCRDKKKCELDSDFINIPSLNAFYDNKIMYCLYILFIVYCVVFFLKSFQFYLKMKATREIYSNKLKLRKKDLENITFTEIMNKLISLQKNENYCRVKDEIDHYDIISRINRKENYLNGLISNKILRFTVNIPFIGLKDYYSNYIASNLMNCIMNYAFIDEHVKINKKFLNTRQLQFRILYYMCLESIFILPNFVLKLLFWVFTNADDIKSNRNINQKIWSPYIKLKFKNYNELKHHFENRMNQSYYCAEKFLSCFQERFFSLVAKFLSLILGSFLILITVLTLIDDSLLFDLRFFGKNLVWFTFVLGFALSVKQGLSSKNDDEILKENIDYMELTELKEDNYKNIINKVVNIPESWRVRQNFSSKVKEMSKYYSFSISLLIDELISIVLFPFFWLKLFLQASDIISFFNNCTAHLEGIGDICSLSVLDRKKFLGLKERKFGLGDVKYAERKFINSYYYFEKNFGVNLDSNDPAIFNNINISFLEKNNEIDEKKIEGTTVSIYETNLDKAQIAQQNSVFSFKFEKKIYEIYIKDRGIFDYFDKKDYKLFVKMEFDTFRRNIYYYINETNQELFKLNDFNSLFPNHPTNSDKENVELYPLDNSNISNELESENLNKTNQDDPSSVYLKVRNNNSSFTL